MFYLRRSYYSPIKNCQLILAWTNHVNIFKWWSISNVTINRNDRSINKNHTQPNNDKCLRLRFCWQLHH